MANPLALEIKSPDMKKLIKNARKVSSPGRVNKQIRFLVFTETKKLKRALAIKISQEGPIGTFRNYRNKIGTKVRGTGIETIGKVAHDNVLYAGVIEEGRGKGKAAPPPSALVPWIKDKLGVTDEEEAERQSFILSRVIANKGTFQPNQQATRGQPGPGLRQFARVRNEEAPGIRVRMLEKMAKWTAKELTNGIA
jgi:hypothetical protein